MEKAKAIGIFDSGVGGVSVLARAIKALPQENFVYYADTANFPYGDQDPAVIKRGLAQAAAELVTKDIKALVVACNTATSIAIEDIRAAYDMPILGMEPALKPAVAKAQDKTVAVIATTLTLRERKFQHLLDQCRAKGKIINLPAPGLADLVENGHYNDAEAARYLEDLFRPLKAVDAIVLGCTHYLFLTPIIKQHFPQVEIIDGGSGTVKHLCHILEDKGLLAAGPGGAVEVLTSAPKIFLPKFPGHLDYIMKVLETCD